MASHPDGVALGPDADATGERATAVGTQARATHANATAMGHGARTSRADQMAFGTGSSTYTMPGITSRASRTAQSGPLEVVTTDRAGNLAGDGGRIFHALGDLREESRQGIASAMAMTGAPMPSAAGRTSWTANVSAFRGEAAFGASIAHRFDTAMPLALTAGYAYGGGDSHGGRVGLAGEF